MLKKKKRSIKNNICKIFKCQLLNLKFKFEKTFYKKFLSKNFNCLI